MTNQDQKNISKSKGQEKFIKLSTALVKNLRRRKPIKKENSDEDTKQQKD